MDRNMDFTTLDDFDQPDLDSTSSPQLNKSGVTLGSEFDLMGNETLREVEELAEDPAPHTNGQQYGSLNDSEPHIKFSPGPFSRESKVRGESLSDGDSLSLLSLMDLSDTMQSGSGEEPFEYSKRLVENESYIHQHQNNIDEMKINSKESVGCETSRMEAECLRVISKYMNQMDDLKAKIEEAEATKVELIKERDQALEDLNNVESAFADVHRKYERVKGLLENLKKNEEMLVERDQELMKRIHDCDLKMETLKEKAQETLEEMDLAYESKIKDVEMDNVKVRAQYRMMEMKLESAERDLEQKGKENAQLKALCNELISGDVVK